MSSNDVITVAIDGPSASGKSTVARRSAEQLGFSYVDSGAFYRGLTWKALREGVDFSMPERVAELTHVIKLDLYLHNRVVMFTIDGDDPTDQLRSEPVRERVSDIAAVPEVRAYLVQMLRSTTRFGHLVMEGRDIGTVVFPHSMYKFYLDADPEERARRRYLEILEAEGASDVGAVMDSLKRRDYKDANRKTAPLQIALGAKVIDSTTMSIDDVVSLVVQAVRKAL